MNRDLLNLINFIAKTNHVELCSNENLVNFFSELKKLIDKLPKDLQVTPKESRFINRIKILQKFRSRDNFSAIQQEYIKLTKEPLTTTMAYIRDTYVQNPNIESLQQIKNILLGITDVEILSDESLEYYCSELSRLSYGVLSDEYTDLLNVELIKHIRSFCFSKPIKRELVQNFLKKAIDRANGTISFMATDFIVDENLPTNVSGMMFNNSKNKPDSVKIMNKITAPQLLETAAKHMAERAKTYDKPEGERSMGKTVQAFNVITGRDLTESEGWLLMQILKDVRLFQRPGYHADSAEDCIAYAALKAESKAQEIDEPKSVWDIKCDHPKVNVDFNHKPGT